MYSLPTSVQTKDGKTYHITDDGDFRVVLNCFTACNDMELTSEDEQVLACLLIFYNEFTDFDDLAQLSSETMDELVKFMFNFFNCGQPEERLGMTKNKKLIDWEDDEMLITAAINNVAHTEIRSLEYLHWWTFMGFYLSIGESVLSTVVSIRDKLTSGKKLEDYEKEFKKNNPEYFVWNNKTREDKEAEEYINSIWGRR